jgi:hypothetical protein
MTYCIRFENTGVGESGLPTTTRVSSAPSRASLFQRQRVIGNVDLDMRLAPRSRGSQRQRSILARISRSSRDGSPPDSTDTVRGGQLSRGGQARCRAENPSIAAGDAQIVDQTGLLGAPASPTSEPERERISGTRASRMPTLSVGPAEFSRLRDRRRLLAAQLGQLVAQRGIARMRRIEIAQFAAQPRSAVATAWTRD